VTDSDPDPTPHDAADDDLAWTTLDSRVDYSCPGFDVRVDDVRLPDGTEGEYHSVTEPDAVVVLPFTPDGDVVVIEEWRQAVGRVNRGIPAGTVDGEEELSSAAGRELREETGYTADRLEPLATVEPLNGVSDAVHHHFAAYGCERQGDQRLDGDESIRAETTPYRAFRDAVRAGEVRDGRAVLAVAYYELLGP
jgi:ADP-ribose pyrophosphatase